MGQDGGKSSRKIIFSDVKSIPVPFISLIFSRLIPKSRKNIISIADKCKGVI